MPSSSLPPYYRTGIQYAMEGQTKVATKDPLPLEECVTSCFTVLYCSKGTVHKQMLRSSALGLVQITFVRHTSRLS
jgi:hypothetical protein